MSLSIRSCNAGARSVALRTDRPYSKGDEVYVSYGQKTSALLLLSYGFIPAPGTCRFQGSQTGVRCGLSAHMV